MNQVLLPTSKAQVSGHRFLMRRVQHGVVLGDIRMIHDPLGRRRRALYTGVAAAAIVGVGSGALAVFSPVIEPGDAAIIVADSGALYVRIDAAVHPVSNLASARLITGQADVPVRASDTVLAQLPRGIAVGIPDAPGMVAALPDQDALWSACHHEVMLEGLASQVSVRVGPAPDALTPHTALLAEHAGHEYLITQDGRALLPARNSREGRIVRRRLGIDAQVSIWRPPPELLNVIVEQPPIQFPQDAQEVFVAEVGAWLRTEHGLQPITELQRGMLVDAGVRETPVSAGILAEQPDAPPALLSLPAHPLTFVELNDSSTVCVTGEQGATSIQDEDAAQQHAVALGGEGIARQYQGPQVGIGVDTGHGLFVVSDVGRAHRVGTHEELRALGVQETMTAPWSVVRLLPQGPELLRDQALLPRY